MMKFYCNTCGSVVDENELEEPYGLSGMEPACPYCQGSDFGDVETKEEWHDEMMGEIQRHGGGG